MTECAEKLYRVRLACEAMRVRFELVLIGDDAPSLGGGGEEALAEILRLGRQLNRFDPRSDLSRINVEAAKTWVPVEAELFGLLLQCDVLTTRTDGRFDVTAPGRKERVAGMLNLGLKELSKEERWRVKCATSMNDVEMDAVLRTVHFPSPAMWLDLGAIGKGYALDRAARALREAGVKRALLHGGTSSILAMGMDEKGAGNRFGELDLEEALPCPWRIGIANPDAAQEVLETVELVDAAMGLSCNREQLARNGEAHVVDPRTGEAADCEALAVVIAESATEADALSTAMLVEGRGRPRWLEPGMRAMRFELREGRWTKTVDETG